MRAVLVLGLVLVVAYTACGSSDSGEGGADDVDQPAGSLLTVVGLDERFQPQELEAPAGPVTITFDNQDEGVLHNIRFYEGSDSDGRFIRKSELERGPEVQTLSMDLQPGSYFYDCEVHPASMTGTLLVR